MNDPDDDVQRQLLDQRLAEVEQRLRLLKDQIVALSSEGEGKGVQAELLFTTFKTLRSLKRLRLESVDDADKQIKDSAS